MKTRRILSALLILCFAAGLVPLAAAPARAEVAFSGTGTISDPYQIADYEELKTFSDIVNGKGDYADRANQAACAVLTDNITATGTDWTPIGDGSGADADGEKLKYTGTFDGQGHTITGLNCNEPASGYAGLFGYVGEGGTVQNVSLSRGSITGSCTGGIAGANKGIIQNCSFSGSVSGSTTGGVVGTNRGGTVQNCYYTGKILAICFDDSPRA